VRPSKTKKLQNQKMAAMMVSGLEEQEFSIPLGIIKHKIR